MFYVLTRWQKHLIPPLILSFKLFNFFFLLLVYLLILYYYIFSFDLKTCLFRIIQAQNMESSQHQIAFFLCKIIFKYVKDYRDNILFLK